MPTQSSLLARILAVALTIALLGVAGWLGASAIFHGMLEHPSAATVITVCVTVLLATSIHARGLVRAAATRTRHHSPGSNTHREATDTSRLAGVVIRIFVHAPLQRCQYNIRKAEQP